MPVATDERVASRVKDLQVSVYTVPTDLPEADGTIHWQSTTMVLVEVSSDSGHRGLGYSYASPAAATLVRGLLREVVLGRDVEDIRGTWLAMVDAVRNVGRPGIAAMAISAIDTALWDLKARIHEQPLFLMLGARRREVPIYGSGGFTTYTIPQLQEQLGGWAEQGIPRVKMKLATDWGTRPEEDVARVKAARQAIGAKTELFVDANGGYTVKQAIDQAARFADQGVSYFEEPVSSDHLEQLRFVREHVSMDVAAGEYAYDPWYVRAMLQAGAVDIQQADATRCLGTTGWLQAADIAYGFATLFSAHCAPSIHAVIGCAAPQLSHVEYFHDHVRIERMMFDGVLEPVDGCLRPDPGRPGLGLELKRSDVARFQVKKTA
ncbi:MAG: enolase C-terminal domain-like protein [Candidatus Dormibacter sp.]